MTEQSFFRALQRLLGIPAREVPRDIADAIKPGSITPQSNPFIDRLKSRSDWHGGTAKDHAAQMAHVIETDGDGVDLTRPPVAPWDRPGARYQSPLSDPWPVQDDPYANPEPCEIEPDPAISTIAGYAGRTNENTRRLAERGLAGRPMDSVKSVTDLLQLIQRQEAAELHLRKIGMVWDCDRGWHLPDPNLA